MKKTDLQAEIDYCESVITILEGTDRGLNWLVNWGAMMSTVDPVRIMIPEVMREELLQQLMITYQYQLTQARAKLESAD